MLGDKQRQTLFYFLDTLSLVCSEGVSLALADSVEERLHKSLALIERDFPMNVQVYKCVHIIIMVYSMLTVILRCTFMSM